MTTPGPGDRDPRPRPATGGPATGGPAMGHPPTGDPATGHPAMEAPGREPAAGAMSRHEPAGPPATDDTVPMAGDQEWAPGDRARRRAAARAFRSHRTLPATLVAILIAAAAVVTLVGAVAAGAGARTRLPTLSWLAPLGRARWDDPATLTTAAVACLLGLLLLIAALTPGRARLVALASEDPQTVTGITRAGLRRHLAAVAAAVDGVSRARVRLRRHRAEVTVATPLRDPEGLPGQVGQAVEDRLTELRPLRPMRVRVAVRRKGE
ncbi:DUF6286 domain-containing protein [Sphaerisporangium dianthi]|uniref:DUF6286 domain-containing protein n=1 Tax=Sphaerisporangium dianthi TaxID=1436120 RepID=A0ABV9CQR5_9ACTN